MGTSLGQVGGNIVSFIAADDYSAKQYRLVKLTAANTVGTTSATTDAVIGILQNKPVQNGVADVLLLNAGGVAKVVTGGTIAAGGLVCSGTDGRAVAPLTADAVSSRYIGYAVEASTTTAASGGGDIISVLIQPTIGTTS